MKEDKLTRFQGVLAPIPTPFERQTCNVWREGFYNLLRFIKGKGVHGVFALGSYGSFPLLEPNERIEAMRIVSEYCSELELFNVMHIGAAATLQAQRYADEAQTLGVDAIASVSPYYYSGHGYRWEDVLRYHTSLIRNSSVPYCVYNNPRTTGYQMKPSELQELARGGASGLKDSGNDGATFAAYQDVTRGLAFNCMPGSGSTMLESFQKGAKAIVAGTAVSFPAEVMALYRAIVQDEGEAQLRKLQQTVKDCRAEQEATVMRPAASYMILRSKGVDIGVPRQPWPDIV